MSPFGEGWTKAEIEAAIDGDDLEPLVYVPIVVSMDPPDCGWAQGVCCRLATHPQPQIRANAILGFGHLARTCGELDETKIRPLIANALTDSDKTVRAQANAAASDIDHYLSWDPPLISSSRGGTLGSVIGWVKIRL